MSTSLKITRTQSANKFSPAKILIYTLLILGCLTTIFPFYWMTVTAFKTEGLIWQNPHEIIPSSLTLENFKIIGERIPFARIFGNTVLFAVGVTLISIFFDSMTAYALAILEVPGRKVFLMIFIATLMIPFQITMIPLYMFLSQLGWLNSFHGLIIPRATSAFGYLLVLPVFSVTSEGVRRCRSN